MSKSEKPQKLSWFCIGNHVKIVGNIQWLFTGNTVFDIEPNLIELVFQFSCFTEFFSHCFWNFPMKNCSSWSL